MGAVMGDGCSFMSIYVSKIYNFRSARSAHPPVIGVTSECVEEKTLLLGNAF